MGTTSNVTPGERPGRTALITGAGSGMGRATTLALSGRGYNVVAGDLNIDAATATAAEASAGAGRVKAARVDVRERESVRELVEGTVENFGSLDLAVNCAGVAGGGVLLADTPDDFLRTVVDVNILGVWYSMTEELRAMTSRGSGVIVNVASATALRAAPRSAAYSMSKAAVVHATKSAALEYAPQGIRVVAICPGPVNTPMLQRLSEQDIQRIVSGVPLGRPAEPEEIARAIVWLDSEDASYMTGTVLSLDGGDSI